MAGISLENRWAWAHSRLTAVFNGSTASIEKLARNFSTQGAEPNAPATTVTDKRTCHQTTSVGQQSSDMLSMAHAKLNMPIEKLSRPQSRKAKEVFAIPELLEAILLHLNIRNLLAVRKVNKSFAATIATSPALQTKMGFRANSTGFFSVAPAGIKYPYPTGAGLMYHSYFPGLQWLCNFTHFPPYSDPTSHRSVDIQYVLRVNQNGNLPRIGTELRRILVSNPPVTSMSVQWSCCPHGQPPSTCHRQDNAVIRKEGITLGDLFDFAEKIVEEHRLCPDAAIAKLNDNGYTMLNTYFCGQVVLAEDDPVVRTRVKRSREAETRERESQQARRSRTEKLEAYTRAKRAARDAGKPIPTLAEWEVSTQH